jgi:hypothetical protein
VRGTGYNTNIEPVNGEGCIAGGEWHEQVELGRYPFATPEYSSPNLYQVSFHIQ